MTSELQQLTEDRDKAYLAAQIAQLEQQKFAAQAAAKLTEDTYRLVDLRDRYFDEPGSSLIGILSKPQFHYDYEDGNFLPFWANESHWREFRGLNRYLYTTDEASINIVENLVNYSVKDGFDVSAIEKTDGSASAGLIDECQACLSDFDQANNWKGWQDALAMREFVQDGELFVAVDFDDFEGVAYWAPVPSHTVKEPSQSRRQAVANAFGVFPESWSYGIARDRIRNRFRYLGFYATSDTQEDDWRFYDAAEVTFFKRNTPAMVARGISDLWSASDRLRRVSRLATNCIQGATTQASIALIRNYDAKTSGPYGAMGTTTQVELTKPDETTETQYLEPDTPGKILDSKGISYEPGPMGNSNSQDYIEVGREGRTISGLPHQMPEYMSTGVSDNVNHAASLTAESPFVLAGARRQSQWRAVERCVAWKVLQAHLRPGGRLARGFQGLTLDALRQQVRIDVQAPSIEARDRLGETQRNRLLHDSGVISMQTWAAREGVDRDEERERIAIEREASAEDELDISTALKALGGDAAQTTTGTG